MVKIFVCNGQAELGVLFYTVFILLRYESFLSPKQPKDLSKMDLDF